MALAQVWELDKSSRQTSFKHELLERPHSFCFKNM